MVEPDYASAVTFYPPTFGRDKKEASDSLLGSSGLNLSVPVFNNSTARITRESFQPSVKRSYEVINEEDGPNYNRTMQASNQSFQLSEDQPSI